MVNVSLLIWYIQVDLDKAQSEPLVGNSTFAIGRKQVEFLLILRSSEIQ